MYKMNLALLKQTIMYRKPDLSNSTCMMYVTSIMKYTKDIYPEGDIDIDTLQQLSMDDIARGINPSWSKSGLKNYYCAWKALTGLSQLTTEITAISIQATANTRTHIPTQQDIDNQLSEDDKMQILDKCKLLAEEAYTSIAESGFEYRKFKLIQDYIVLCITSGKYISPRRTMDWTSFKIKNVTMDVDNYFGVGNTIVFNKFKTAKISGPQIISIPIELGDILERYCRVNPYEFLLANRKGEIYNSPSYNHMLNAIFHEADGYGKGHSTNAMRHSYLQNKYSETISVARNLKNDMKLMGSSLADVDYYIKEF